MIGGYFYRECRAINLLAAVAIAFLLFDPEQMFEASFQLTFLAVGFLAVFAVPLIRATSGPLARGLRDLDDAGRDPYLPPKAAQFRVEMRLLAETAARLLRLPLGAARVLIAAPARAALFVYEVVATSAVVQLGLALPMVIYFHRIGLSGLSANAFVVPIMSLVVPLGFVAVFTSSSVAAGGAGLLLSLSQRVVSWHAALEPQWRVPDPPAWLGLALAAALVGAALVRGKWQRGSALGLVGVLLTLLIWSPFPADAVSGSLEMTMIDVGQGESIFLGLPDGRRVLLDGGGFPSYGREPTSRLDIGEDVVAPYLWGRGIRRLDVVIASHGHEDHIGGLPAVVTAFRPKELWVGGEPKGAAWTLLLDAAARAAARVVPMCGPRRLVYGGAQFEVLAPGADFVPSENPKNNDSLVLRLTFGRHSFLLTGDIEGAVERRILYEAGVERAAVLKTPHHGSRSSSTGEFLDAVSPMFAAISAGHENTYGNPHPEVLGRLGERGATAYRTDRDGLITIRTNGHRLEVETNRQRGQSGVMPAW
jgi:competence protein ComEC